MKPRLLTFLAVLLTPVAAWAHPGHAGHDFEWDFAPVATGLIIFATIAGGAIWKKRRDQNS